MADLDETIVEGTEVDLDETVIEEAEQVAKTEPPKPAGGPKPVPAPKPAENPAPQLPTAPVVREDVEGEQTDEDDDSTDDSESESDVMLAGLTEEQKRIMKQKFATMKVGYQEAMKKQEMVKINEVKNTLEFWCDTTISDDLATFILEFTARHDMNFREKVESNAHMFLDMMREMHQQAKIKDAQEDKRDKQDGDYTSAKAQPESEDDDQEFVPGAEDWVKDAMRRKAKHKKKREALKVKHGERMDGKKRVGRLLLDDALKDKSKMDGWSEARKKAWKNKDNNPNSYYYRFNEPGEKQGNGGFTDKEHKIFMKRLLEFGANNKWGVFSMKIPGRVGYQCSNYYRDLVKKKIIHDPNYFWDGKKLHFKRGVKAGKSKTLFEALRWYNFTVKEDKSGVWKKNSRHPKAPKLTEEEAAAYAANAAPAPSSGSEAPNKKRKRKAKGTRGARKKRKAEDEDFDFCTSAKKRDTEDDNPIPEFIDPIDGAPVQVPAISPYGHVCGYANWTKILRQENAKNTCPFTKRPLGRRELVKLTKANYAEYKDKIINWRN